MTTIKLCAALTTFSILLLSCSSYRPVGEYGGIPHGGYTDSMTDSNTAIVSFDGNLATSQQTVENYLLHRCAKITLDNGYTYFIITSTNLSAVNINVRTQDTTRYMTNPPRLFTAYPETSTYASSSYSTTEVECRYSAGAPCRPQVHTVTAVIKMFRGSMPRGVPRTYNAQDVIGHLAPQTF
jgi:hypothetical protein